MAVIIVLILCFTRMVIGKQEGFIVGGDETKNIKEFAYCAFLDIDDTFTCGSSIVNQDILLSAAHCFTDAKRITVTVGSVNRENGQLHKLSKYFVHAGYDETTIQNDIALGKLKTPLKFGPTVQRVVLLRATPSDREGVVAGWGAVEEKDYADTVLLKHTRQKLWTYRSCKAVLTSLPTGAICGGERTSKRDFASRGDSGSALVVRKCIQVGLVSFKDPRSSRSLVAYTDVSYFHDWIISHSRKLMCKG